MFLTVAFGLSLLVFGCVLLAQSLHRWVGSSLTDWTKITGISSVALVILGFLTLMAFAPQQSQQFLTLLSNIGPILGFLFLVIFVLAIMSVLGGIQQGITRQVYSHLQVWYFGRNNNPTTPYGDSLLLIGRKRRAYMVSPKVDELVKSKIVKWNTEPCLTRERWLRREKISLDTRAVPRDDELLEGSPSKFVGLFELLYRRKKR